jgi:secreted trypsin-like serine protease
VSVSYLSNSVLQHHCEGIIYNPNWIITTATCFTYQQPAPLDQYRIRTGVLNLANPEATQAIYEISNIVTYPGASFSHHDLALARTHIPIIFNVNTQPILIASAINFNLPFYTASYFPNQIKHFMRALTLPNGSCFNAFPGNDFPVLQPTQLCGLNVNVDGSSRSWQTCVAGSRPTGSPLLELEATGMTAISIASWTVDNQDCNSQTHPTISTNLIFYRAWITSNAV